MTRKPSRRTTGQRARPPRGEAWRLPVVRSPRLCTHSHPVLARQQQRCEEESVREALRREREEGW